MKVRAVESHKAEVILFGETYDECYEKALDISEKENLTFIHPFDDPEVIAGQGTIGMEIMRQAKQPPNASVWNWNRWVCLPMASRSGKWANTPLSWLSSS